ncbi:MULTISPECIES: hypothetical protein [Streptosporangiaceae]|uniref:hypothetical protein n=1 Tax=Streptosporangiaceae TaxID=2004 RepID=UPI0033C87D59
MADLTVYRTRQPETVALAASYTEAYKAWQARVAETLTDLGFPEREPVVAGALLRYGVAGIKHQDGEMIPPGWRVTWMYDQDLLVPDRRTKAGKAAGARLEQLEMPTDPRRLLPGMPAEVRIDGHRYNPGMACRENDSALYVTWKHAPPADWVDTVIWDRVPLSEYYAVVEAEDAAQDGGEHRG